MTQPTKAECIALVDSMLAECDPTTDPDQQKLFATIRAIRAHLTADQSELRDAVEQAKILIGARNDTLSEARHAANINQAWHLLDKALAANPSTPPAQSSDAQVRDAETAIRLALTEYHHICDCPEGSTASAKAAFDGLAVLLAAIPPADKQDGVWVPIEPTKAMYDAAFREVSLDATMGQIWAVMIAARPKAGEA